MGIPCRKVEARASVRYQIEASVIFSWETQTGQRLRGEGITREIGVGDIYVLTPTCPPVGAVVLLEVFLAFSDKSASRDRLKIATEGIVIRIDHQVHGERRPGFAARTGDCEIVRHLSN